MQKYDRADLLKEARMFRALGEPTRLMLAAILSSEGEVCVCRLAEALDIPDYRISRHLGRLRSVGLVEGRREGTWIHYRLTPPAGKMGECLTTILSRCLADAAPIRRARKKIDASTCSVPVQRGPGS